MVSPTDDKVVTLPGVANNRLINQGAITLLEDAVTELKSGDIIGVVLVKIRVDHASSPHWDVPTHYGNDAYVGIDICKRLMLQRGDEV